MFAKKKNTYKKFNNFNTNSMLLLQLFFKNLRRNSTLFSFSFKGYDPNVSRALDINMRIFENVKNLKFEDETDYKHVARDCKIIIEVKSIKMLIRCALHLIASLILKLVNRENCVGHITCSSQKKCQLF